MSCNRSILYSTTVLAISIILDYCLFCVATIIGRFLVGESIAV
ncbi:hypothetical protein [Cyanobacterium sp. Dongsha4]|nr:hypothetical protein [Cyanobacterium sp. Dongsha4]